MPDKPTTPEPIYYHGGPSGLREGDVVAPPAATGKEPISDLSHPGMVYVTDVYERARFYAVTRGLFQAGTVGQIYVVKPAPPLTDDPTAWFPGAYCCPSARVLKVLSIPFSEVLALIMPHVPYILSRALFGQDDGLDQMTGYMNPNTVRRAEQTQNAVVPAASGTRASGLAKASQMIEEMRADLRRLKEARSRPTTA